MKENANAVLFLIKLYSKQSYLCESAWQVKVWLTHMVLKQDSIDNLKAHYNGEQLNDQKGKDNHSINMLGQSYVPDSVLCPQNLMPPGNPVCLLCPQASAAPSPCPTCHTF